MEPTPPPCNYFSPQAPDYHEQTKNHNYGALVASILVSIPEPQDDQEQTQSEKKNWAHTMWPPDNCETTESRPINIQGLSLIVRLFRRSAYYLFSYDLAIISVCYLLIDTSHLLCNTSLVRLAIVIYFLLLTFHSWRHIIYRSLISSSFTTCYLLFLFNIHYALLTTYHLQLAITIASVVNIIVITMHTSTIRIFIIPMVTY